MTFDDLIAWAHDYQTANKKLPILIGEEIYHWDGVTVQIIQNLDDSSMVIEDRWGKRKVADVGELNVRPKRPVSV